MGEMIVTTSQASLRLCNFCYIPDKVVVLENTTDIDEVIAQFNDMYYPSAKAFNHREIVDFWANSIRPGILGGLALFMAIAIFLSSLITLLVTQIAVHREQADMGALKACGYSTLQLRRQFVLRFVLVSAMGCIAGLALALAFSDKTMSAVLGLAGVFSYAADKSLIMLLGPVVFLCTVTTIMACLSTRRICKLGLRSLNTE
jgi:ABC-type antimicrobial peptide transport system permease subunit